MGYLQLCTKPREYHSPIARVAICEFQLSPSVSAPCLHSASHSANPSFAYFRILLFGTWINGKCTRRSTLQISHPQSWICIGIYLANYRFVRGGSDACWWLLRDGLSWHWWCILLSSSWSLRLGVIFALRNWIINQQKQCRQFIIDMWSKYYRTFRFYIVSYALARYSS